MSSSQGPGRRGAALVALLAVSLAATVPSATEAAATKLTPRPLPVKSLLFSLGPAADPQTLVVKLEDDAPVEAKQGRWQAAEEKAAARAVAGRLDVALAAAGAGVEPLIHQPRAVLEALRRLGEANTGESLADLSQLYRVRLPAGGGRALLERLLALPEVENAYAEPRFRPPVDLAPPTPNLLPSQGYRAPAPEGIGLEAAWTRGLRGQGVTVADVEINGNLRHEDLDHLAGQVPPVPIVPEAEWDTAGDARGHHGTAVLGVLASGDNGYGTTGLVPGAKIRFSPAFTLTDPAENPANAVVRTTLALAPGDVMLIELHFVDVHGVGHPVEIFDAEFAVIRQATALGIHVVEPAGNSAGGLLLDAFPQFDWRVRDSGAIFVAGGLALANGGFHNRQPNSNRGRRIDAYAWGESIVTLGFGPPASDHNHPASCNRSPDNSDLDQFYTSCFNGTSGASAIVTGAATVLAQRHAEKWGRPATPAELRNLLRLGTPGLQRIGHQPDLPYQLDLLDKGGVVAQVFAAEPSANSFEPEQGQAIAGPGDVDGDGLADVAVGAPLFSVPGATPQLFAGRVYLFSSRNGRLLWTATGAARDRLGHALAACGDLDGDGAGDLAAGAPFADGERGKVTIFSGRNGDVLATLTGAANGERFGWALASTRGDDPGYLIIGAPGASGGGRVVLASGFDGSVIRQYHSPEPDAEFGFAVGGGDFDGDGQGDVLVGAPSEKNAAGAIVGAVYGFDGGHSSELFAVRGEAPLVFASNRFGAAVAGVGDFSRDGLDDFVAGAPNWSDTFAQPGFGRVYLYRSTAGNPALVRTFTGPRKHARLGESVAGVGDYNGDGFLDVAAGEPAIAGGFTQPTDPPRLGRVRIFSGPFVSLVVPRAVASPVLPKDRLFSTKDPDSCFGRTVAAVGDTNGDGLPDLGIGEPLYEFEGRAFVFAFRPGPAATPAP